MHITVFELLADRACCFGRTRGLELDDFDEVRDSAEVVFGVGLGGEVLDGDGDRRVRLLLGSVRSGSELWLGQ